jgi:ammonia channel protein AmtB
LACYWGATGLKRLLQADDSLDVFGVHGIGGIVGSLLTGLLASPLVSGVQGSIATQALATLVVLAYGAVMSAVLLIVIRKLVGLRVDESAEQTGWTSRNTASALAPGCRLPPRRTPCCPVKDLRSLPVCMCSCAARPAG